MNIKNLLLSLFGDPDGVHTKPQLLVLAGPNGAGKSTFYKQYLDDIWSAPFINADQIARGLNAKHPELVAATASRHAYALRYQYLNQTQSFAMETVFTSAVHQLKLANEAKVLGYDVTLVYIGLDTAMLSQTRVIQRVTIGGHDISDETLIARFPKSLENLKRAIKELKNVVVIDNSDAGKPFQLVAAYKNGVVIWHSEHLPNWFEKLNTERLK
jgi:predicted ABC-type ATPase